MNIRNFKPDDAPEINALALLAFDQFKDRYEDWPGFRTRIGNMAGLADTGEIIIAEVEGVIVGAVAYIGAHAAKPAFFRPEWPIMRMLVVSPAARGQGIGRALAEACLARARRDGATMFALHTSELMQIALPMYLRMGFEWAANTPDIHGVKYSVYTKSL
ncbi:GNAT family N-acetyltransferase [Burkholderiaceae bacterium DAT-1]|nr:GNAT family N-acetyltransferase [Burkholderiaceae bacterium DAT-1]